MIDTILFDFDGTLMDTNKIIIASWQYTFQQLKGCEADENILITKFGEPLEKTMREFFPDVPTCESMETYRSYQRDRFTGSIELFPGVEEMLRDVKAAGYKTAVVTSRLVGTTMEALDKFGITKYLDAVVTPEDTAKHKPDPEPALVALDKLQSKPENAVMLGDTMFDVMCANNAGVKSILVGWTFALRNWQDEDFGENKPAYKLANTAELLELLKQI